MKRLLTFTAAAVCALVLAVQPAAAASSFPDVPKANRFHDEIQYLTGQKIISGYTNGSFQPKKNVSRGEAAIMIGRMLDLNGAKRNTKFKDVNAQNGASGYIASAAEKGIISGYADGTFRPKQYITRGDMAIILSRALGLEFNSVLDFKDVGLQMNASTAISHVAAEYITTGYEDQTFRPGNQITREQFSAFLARALNPVYRQKVVYKGGYSRNLLKNYVYATEEGDVQYAYRQGTPKGLNAETYNGFAWEIKNLKTGEVEYELEDETKEGLFSGLAYSEYYKDLAYPIIKGKKYEASYSKGNGRQYTGVNQTVKTPYKTFTDAVEVKTENGYKVYFVKGIGQVKLIDPSGKTVSALKAIQ